jgi:apolipoprotein N-acyltransferase
MPNPAVDPYPSIYCDLLAGGKTYDDGGHHRGPYKNTAFLMNRDYEIAGRYVKRSLMPIGEYMPYEEWFPSLRKWAALDKKIIRGTDNRPLTLSGGGKIGVLVCYEDMVADNARTSTTEGAQCLIALVNGSAFTDADTLRQHLQLAQLRSIENRRSLVRCAATGISCHVGPDGVIGHSLPIGVEGSMVVNVPLLTSVTFYTQHGPWFERLLSVIAIALLAVMVGIGRKAQRTLTSQSF